MTICPLCDEPVIKVPWLCTYRRDDKALCIELHIWQCQSCKDFDDEKKLFAFVDSVIGRENDALVGLAWRQVYDEPMPETRRPKSQ